MHRACTKCGGTSCQAGARRLTLWRLALRRPERAPVFFESRISTANILENPQPRCRRVYSVGQDGWVRCKAKRCLAKEKQRAMGKKASGGEGSDYRPNERSKKANGT